MKRKTLGFALLLLGNILAVPDALFFYAGLLMGSIGLCLVVSGMQSDKSEVDKISKGGAQPERTAQPHQRRRDE